MKTKRLFLMLALLMTAVAGAWADEIVMTTADIGKVICTDRSFYPTVADAQAAGKTPVAMIAYLDEANCKGLAISLEDGTITSNTHTDNPIDGCKINTAINIANSYNTTHAVEGGTWRVPTVNDWEHMFIGCGSTSTYVESLPYQTLLTADTPHFSSGNMQEMMVAAGGKPFYASYISRGYWTVNNLGGISGDMRWAYFFKLGIGQDNYIIDVFDGEVQAYVRPCLEFTLPGYAVYLTFKDGTEDVQNWTIDPNPTLKGKSTVLKYSGSKVVKNVRLVKSGQKGYCPYPDYYLRKKEWIFIVDEDDEVEIEYDDTYTVFTRKDDNSALLEEMDGKTSNVVFDAELPQGWSVLTLPVDLPDGFPSSLGIEIKKFVGSSYVPGINASQGPKMKLFFEDAKGIKAGVPYLVMAPVPRDLFNYPVMDATIHKTTSIMCSKHVEFVPLVTRAFIEGDPQNVVFLEPSITRLDVAPWLVINTPIPFHPELPHYALGLSGYFMMVDYETVFPDDMSYEVVFGPYEPEPVSEKTEEKPGDFANAGEISESESSIIASLGTDDKVDPEDGSVTMYTQQLTTAEVEALMEAYAPGSTAVMEQLKGFFFLVAAGKGYVEFDIETYGYLGFAPFVDFILSGVYTMASKGTLTVKYDSEKDVWIYAVPVVTTSESSARQVDVRRAPEAEGYVKVYGIRVIPEDDSNGIKETFRSKSGDGNIYNINGQRVNTLKKGLYIIDGRKMVVK